MQWHSRLEDGLKGGTQLLVGLCADVSGWRDRGVCFAELFLSPSATKIGTSGPAWRFMCSDVWHSAESSQSAAVRLSQSTTCCWPPYLYTPSYTTAPRRALSAKQHAIEW